MNLEDPKLSYEGIELAEREAITRLRIKEALLFNKRGIEPS